jgi:hypothetical protein
MIQIKRRAYKFYRPILKREKWSSMRSIFRTKKMDASVFNSITTKSTIRQSSAGIFFTRIGLTGLDTFRIISRGMLDIFHG